MWNRTTISHENLILPLDDEDLLQLQQFLVLLCEIYKWKSDCKEVEESLNKTDVNEKFGKFGTFFEEFFIKKC